MARSFDINRVMASALEAALSEEQPRRRRPMRTLATGATLLTIAGVAGRKHAPHLTKLGVAKLGIKGFHDLSSLRNVPDALRDRLRHWEEPDAEDAEPDDEGQDEPGVDEEREQPQDEASEEPEDEEPEPPEDEEPEQAGDEEPEQPEDEEPEQAGDEEPEQPEDEEPEDPTDEEDEDGPARENPGMETPDLTRVLSRTRRPAPVLDRIVGNLDPAGNPPEPLERASRGRRTGNRKRKEPSGG